jgi:hypothetical protein
VHRYINSKIKNPGKEGLPVIGQPGASCKIDGEKGEAVPWGISGIAEDITL